MPLLNRAARWTCVAVMLAACAGGPELPRPPARSLSAPRWIRLSFVGDTAHRMGVTWNTLGGRAGAKVRFSTRPRGEGRVASGRIRELGGVFGTQSEVILEPLRPQTTYYYRVGGGSGGWSDERSFRTPPAKHRRCGRLRFVYFGDSRAGQLDAAQGVSPRFPVLFHRALDLRPLFAIHGGDIVYDGRIARFWPGALATSEPLSARLPLMYSLGNHDDGPGQGERAHYNRLFFLPRAARRLGGGGTEDYYAFRVANALLVALSTVTFTGGSTPMGTQARWLDRVLERSDARWIVVYMHHPIYTNPVMFSHPSDELGQNRALVAVFNRHHVDVVIGAHNHFYERWVPSRCADPGSDEVCPTASGPKTVYITSAGGGSFPIFVPGAPDDRRAAVFGGFHFLVFDIADDRLTMSALDERGRSFDAMTLRKRSGGDRDCAAQRAAGRETRPPPLPLPGPKAAKSGVHRVDIASVFTSIALSLAIVLLIARAGWRSARGDTG